MHYTARTLALGVATFSCLATASPLGYSANPQHLAKRDLASTRGVAKRDIKEIICGFYPTADYIDTLTNSGNLREKGDQNVHVAAHTCNRVGCCKWAPALQLSLCSFRTRGSLILKGNG